jgi:hypothetical protein
MAVQYLKELMSIYKGTSMRILCNILENIPHALDVHAQRVLKYNFILICDFTMIETGRFNVFL